jgi:large repetitive protein
MRRLPAKLVVGACVTMFLVGVFGMTGSTASFTTATSVSANAFDVDHLGNYFSVTPGTDGVAAGEVDTLSIAFGLVPSARTFSRVFTVTNVSGAPQTATLSSSGAAQVAAVTFNASGTATATLAPGASTSVSVRTSATIAGRGTGTVELRLAGSSWLYRTYALSLDEAPEAPASLTAIAHAAGRIALAWPASTTTNLSGYDLYRAAGSGSLTKIATLTGTSHADTATADGTAYRYVVRAVSAGAPSFDSLASPQGTATADATAPAQPSSVASAAYVNAASVSAFQVTVTLPGGSLSTDTVTVSLGGGVSASVPAPQGGGAVTVTLDAGALGEGAVTIQATSADAAGNVSSVATRTVTKDTTAPGAPAATYVDNKNAADQITGTTEGGATITVQQTAPNAGGPFTTTASGVGAYTVTVANAKNVTVRYTVTATDAAGNTSPATTITFADSR